MLSNSLIFCGTLRYINPPKNITNDILTPGWVNYDDRLPYQTYNVSPFINKGKNTIQIWLADGWYRGALMSLQTGLKVSNVWGNKLGAILEIRNEKKILLNSNENWKSGLLPILKSGIYYGEEYNANITPKETDGVAVLDFDKSFFITTCKKSFLIKLNSFNKFSFFFSSNFMYLKIWTR